MHPDSREGEPAAGHQRVADAACGSIKPPAGGLVQRFL